MHMHIAWGNPIINLPSGDGWNPTHGKKNNDLGDDLWFRAFHIIYLSISLSIYLDGTPVIKRALLEDPPAFSPIIFPAMNPFLSHCHFHDTQINPY